MQENAVVIAKYRTKVAELEDEIEALEPGTRASMMGLPDGGAHTMRHAHAQQHAPSQQPCNGAYSGISPENHEDEVMHDGG